MYMMAEVLQYVAVASFAEAWIEISQCLQHWMNQIVASFAEAWIEIVSFDNGVEEWRRLLRGGVD